MNCPSSQRTRFFLLINCLGEDFEKFCFQLGSKSMECLDTSYIYGRKGQKQDGIDLYFRQGTKNKVWQIKRYAEFKQADVSDAVEVFLEGK